MDPHQYLAKLDGRLSELKVKIAEHGGFDSLPEKLQSSLFWKASSLLRNYAEARALFRKEGQQPPEEHINKIQAEVLNLGWSQSLC